MDGFVSPTETSKVMLLKRLVCSCDVEGSNVWQKNTAEEVSVDQSETFPTPGTQSSRRYCEVEIQMMWRHRPSHPHFVDHFNCTDYAFPEQQHL